MGVVCVSRELKMGRYFLFFVRGDFGRVWGIWEVGFLWYCFCGSVYCCGGSDLLFVG